MTTPTGRPNSPPALTFSQILKSYGLNDTQVEMTLPDVRVILEQQVMADLFGKLDDRQLQVLNTLKTERSITQFLQEQLPDFETLVRKRIDTFKSDTQAQLAKLTAPQSSVPPAPAVKPSAPAPSRPAASPPIATEPASEKSAAPVGNAGGKLAALKEKWNALMTPPDPNAAPKKTSPRPEAAAKKSKLPPLPPLPPLPKMGGKGGPPAKPELSEEEKKAEEEKRAKERAEAQQRIEARLREDAAAIEQVRAEIARLSEANAAARRDDSAESPGGEAAVNLGRLRQSLGRAAKTGNWQAASEIVRMIKKLGR